jgi:hypothetical protein
MQIEIKARHTGHVPQTFGRNQTRTTRGPKLQVGQQSSHLPSCCYCQITNRPHFHHPSPSTAIWLQTPHPSQQYHLSTAQPNPRPVFYMPPILIAQWLREQELAEENGERDVHNVWRMVPKPSAESFWSKDGNLPTVHEF